MAEKEPNCEDSIMTCNGNICKFPVYKICLFIFLWNLQSAEIMAESYAQEIENALLITTDRLNIVTVEIFDKMFVIFVV